jgi:two-component system, NarL family, sensor kinase
MTLPTNLDRRSWWPAVPVWLAWALWILAVLGLVATAWFDHLLRQAGRTDLAQLNSGGVLPALAIVSAATAGVVLGSRRPRHPVGWLLLTLGLSVTAIGVADGYARYGLLARPGALPVARVGAMVSPAIMVTVLACIGLVLLLTPTGLLPSPHWRWLARIMVITPLVFTAAMLLLPEPLDPLYQGVRNPLGLPALGGALLVVSQGTLAVTVVAVVAAAGSLVVRFRRARGVERQQLRWVALAAALTGVMALVLEASMTLSMGVTAVFLFAAGACMALLPLAIGAAILRYRLYDLDYLISRTLVYGLLTIVGIVVYVGLVKAAEWGLRQGAGLGGSLVATAVIAVGFAPVRDRLQRWADRRLYGDRHDPVRAVARLGERLRIAPGAEHGRDVLVGILQGVCETLRLPSASLQVDGGTEAASFGRPGADSEQVPLEHEGQQIGTMVIGLRAGERALGAADRQVLEVLAAPVAVALHAVLLSQELQRSQERLVAAREEERRRLRRDLHDGLGPILTAVTLKADAARSTLHAAPSQARELLAELRADAKQAIGDLRRVVEDLRPASLDELGLLGALSQQVDRFTRQGLSVILQAPPTLPVLPAAVEIAAYRICTEALTNIARHAHAQHASIVVAADGALCLEIHDDGATGTTNGGGWRPGVGLVSMAERVAEVGGSLQAGPTPTGGRVRASLPLALP